MYVIAGLGNPGKQYENTKHNIGFTAIDYLADKHGIDINKIKFKALYGEGKIAGEKVILLKPQTYMNLSGESIREIMNFYKLPPENLFVIYDDVDLEMGKIRIRKKGSAGSHNGMKSIIYQLANHDFPRFRVGIDSERKGDLARYVLGGFSKDNLELIEKAIVNVAEAIEYALKFDIDSAMNIYNKNSKKEKKIDE